MNIFTYSRDKELLDCIEHNNVKKVKQLLNSGIDVNLVIYSDTHLEGGTILSLASYHGRDTVVQHLLDHRAQVNFQEPCRRKTALHWACRSGHQKTIQILLENGAGVNCYDRDNETPIICAVKYSKTPRDTTATLIKFGADVRCCDRLHTSPLHYASFRGHTEVSDLLIRAGCISNYPTVLGEGTPLANLVHHGASDSCMLLLAAGYNPRNDRSSQWLQDHKFTEYNPLGRMLVQELRNPPPLTRLCRTCVRNCLRRRLESKIRSLPLPPRLIDYLVLYS